MKISRLRRALAVLLSAAMLIMCMPTVGITAAAVTDTTSCLYVTIPGTEDITTLEEATAKVPESEWTSGTLTEALKVANKPHYNKTVYIKLLSDVTAENYGKTIIFSSYEGNTVFDLNGNTVDGGNGYRCIQISEDYGISKPITITSSAAQRGTITNGMSKSAGAGGIDQNSGKLLLSNLDIINNQTSGMYAAGFYAYGNSTTLSNVKITGNKSLNSNDAYGGVMTYCPFTFKGKVEITGNGNNLGSNNRDLWIVSKGDKSSVSGLTAGSNISLYNPNNKGFTVSSDGGNNPDIYNYFSIANSGFWISPTSSGGIQVTNSVYGVVFDMQGKTDNVVNTVSSGAKATKPSDPTASDGSTFGGWYKDKECTEEFDFTAAITQNTTVYAKWEAPARITITLDPNGGTLSGGATATTNANGTFDSLPAEPTREGYTFGGWYTHATEGKKVTTSTQLDDGDTIYAQWIDELGDGSNPVSVTLLDDAKLNPAENDNTGTKFVFTGIPKLNKAEIDAGFRYIYVVLPIDWYSKEQLENMVANTNNGLKDKDRYDYLLSPSEMENIPSDNTITVTTLSAVQLYKINDHSYKYSVFFEQDCYNIFAEKDFAVGKAAAPAEYTITFDTKGGALPEGTKSTATTTDGKLAELPTPTRDGYVFDGWFDAETGGKEVTTETKFEDNATIYAQWTYAKLDNNVYLAMDDDKMDEFVSKMIVGEDFDSEDVSDLFTIEKNSELFTLSAVLTDWDGKTSGTYTYGTKYYAKVKISPKSGYTFEDITKVTIHVGKYPITPKVNSSENYVELSQTLGYPHYEVEDVSVDEVQVNVDTSNLTLTANEKIDDEAVYNCFSVPDDVIYNVYLYGIAYKDAEGNYVAADLDNGDTYAEGKKYYAKLAIALLAPETVMYNYYFADNVTITFGDGTIPFDVSRRTGACIEGYYPIGTVSTAEPPENEEGDIIVDNSNNYSGAGIADAEEAKSVIPVTDDEKAAIENGENLYIILDVMDGTNTVPTTDRTAVNTIANENGLTVGMILDIELFKRIGENGRDVRITETNGMLTVEFTMPAELLSTDSTVTRTYKIIRVHNGVTDILDCTFDPATGKASFKTNKFSTYAIAYVDVRAAQPQTPAVQYPLNLGTDGRVHSNATTAAAGDKITITVDPGYIAHIISGGREIAKITGTGTFIMPANGIKVVVECELGGLMLTNARSYVYSYDSDMNKIAVSATKKQKNTVTINLGKDYAGKSFVIYEGKKSTSVKVTEGTLDKNGKFTFEVDYGKNYTLVVED